MAKYCIQCGAKLADEAKFCPNCGTASVQPQAQQVQQPQAAQPDAAPFDYGAPTPPPAAQVGEYAYGGAAEPAFDY
ncbi:MAG: zinc ribbon domain-containing protein [Oscillospiraceae bacterium]|nr:zinc ribbon domain-containing protein [Oscillospiraceae bacterium]